MPEISRFLGIVIGMLHAPAVLLIFAAILVLPAGSAAQDLTRMPQRRCYALSDNAGPPGILVLYDRGNQFEPYGHGRFVHNVVPDSNGTLPTVFGNQPVRRFQWRAPGIEDASWSRDRDGVDIRIGSFSLALFVPARLQLHAAKLSGTSLDASIIRPNLRDVIDPRDKEPASSAVGKFLAQHVDCPAEPAFEQISLNRIVACAPKCWSYSIIIQPSGRVELATFRPYYRPQVTDSISPGAARSLIDRAAASGVLSLRDSLRGKGWCPVGIDSTQKVFLRIVRWGITKDVADHLSCTGAAEDVRARQAALRAFTQAIDSMTHARRLFERYLSAERARLRDSATIFLAVRSRDARLVVNGREAGIIDGIQTFMVGSGETRLSIRLPNCAPWDTTVRAAAQDTIRIVRRSSTC